MEFNIDTRRNNLIRFIDYIDEDDVEGGEYSINTSDFFSLKKLSSGVEGTVYKATPLSKKYKRNIIVVKKIDLKAIKDSKDIDRITLRSTPESIFKLFQSDSAFRNHALIEIISSTLLNQLVIQNICPHYILNYYWDLTIEKNGRSKKKYLNMYNEYINNSDFEEWADRKHNNKLWYNALFQIMVGLEAMKRYFDLHHTDFHVGNILVQKVKQGGYWTYIIDSKTYRLPNLGFVFVLSDFGFAWIPDKMKIDWHYKDTLQFITESGKEFYDLHYLLDILLNDNDFEIPRQFRNFIKKNFDPEEIEYVYTRDYFRNRIRRKKGSEYKRRLENYPDIKPDYKGTGKTLSDKIQSLFRDAKSPCNYTQIPTGNEIDKFNLDKKFDVSKLPENFKKLVLKR